MAILAHNNASVAIATAKVSQPIWKPPQKELDVAC